MPGFTIHLAVAKEFLRKNRGYNEEEFYRGTVAPDLVEDKSTTHFAEGSSDSNLEKFLEHYSLDKGYYAGWLLHLITDRIFFKEYLNDWDSRLDIHKLHEDYDKINKLIIEKYAIPILEEITKHIFYKEGETTYLNIETLYKFIEEISDINLEEYGREKNK